MKEIKLTQGFVTSVDDEYYEHLNQFKWCVSKNGNNYCAVRAIVVDGKRTVQPMHQFIMNREWVDHVDGNGLNNQKSNMRYCTQEENNRNSKPHKNSSSEFKGVFWAKWANKWRVRIMYNYKTYNLGYFSDEEEAARVYDLKAKELFGEFAWLNFKLKVA